MDAVPFITGLSACNLLPICLDILGGLLKGRPESPGPFVYPARCFPKASEGDEHDCDSSHEIYDKDRVLVVRSMSKELSTC